MTYPSTQGIALLNKCLYCTLRGQIKGTKCALFSIKCKGAVWKKKQSYEVNLFIVFAPQHIPEDDNCIFAYQHYTRYLTMDYGL